MDGGLPYGDIIILGAIAAFILLRYRAMLGQKSERDETVRPPSKPPALAEYERVVQLPASRTPPPAKEKTPVTDYGSMADTFVAMRAIDREFSPEEFLNGARMAHEMVIKAFAGGDRETLKMLLSDALYQQFDETLARAKESGRIDDTTLVAIIKAQVAEASLKGNIANIAVDFVSDQIHLVRDGAGAVIEGNPSQQDRVEERWMFSRNLASGDPSWKIIET